MLITALILTIALFLAAWIFKSRNSLKKDFRKKMGLSDEKPTDIEHTIIKEVEDKELLKLQKDADEADALFNLAKKKGERQVEIINDRLKKIRRETDVINDEKWEELRKKHGSFDAAEFDRKNNTFILYQKRLIKDYEKNPKKN